jgi:sec-independent protein translocase protein TatA
MGEFSLTHILLLGLIALVLFGPSRLPALGQSLGKAIRGFKQGLTEIDGETRPVQESAPLVQNTVAYQQPAQQIQQAFVAPAAAPVAPAAPLQTQVPSSQNQPTAQL